VGSTCAGIHGLTVLERYQGRGIASALIERACVDVRDLGAQRNGLLASTEGQRPYVRRGSMKWRGSGTGVGAFSATAEFDSRW
jgi:GNAT superfamily N-acetyltransferase